VVDDGVGLDARGPHQQAGVELGPVSQRDAAVDHLLEARTQSQVDTSFGKQVGDIAAQGGGNLGENPGRGVDQNPMLSYVTSVGW
jgi:hypothetical protein